MPLLRALPALPAGTMRCNAFLGAFLEGGDCLCRSHTIGGAGRAALIDRIEPVDSHLAAVQRLLAGLGEGDCMKRAEPMFAQAAGDPVAKDPRGAAGRDLQIKPEAVAIGALSALGEGRHLDRG